jgi:hypothetical protein
MIRMSMREHDRRRRYSPQSPQPIFAAIDHDAGVAELDERRAMATVPARSNIDLATRAEKG